MFGDMGNMMKQAKEMQSKMKKVEKELGKLVVEAESKNGKVYCEVDGKLGFRTIKIDPEFAKESDHIALEKSITEAIKSAMDRAQEEANSRMKDVTGGMKIPGLM